MHKKCGSFGIFWDILGYFGILWDILPGNEKKLLLYFVYPKRNAFKKRGYFRIFKKRKETTVIFRVPEKKQLFYRIGYFKKQRRKREWKVVSTISAFKPLRLFDKRLEEPRQIKTVFKVTLSRWFYIFENFVNGQTSVMRTSARIESKVNE